MCMYVCWLYISPVLNLYQPNLVGWYRITPGVGYSLCLASGYWVFRGMHAKKC